MPLKSDIINGKISLKFYSESEHLDKALSFLLTVFPVVGQMHSHKQKYQKLKEKSLLKRAGKSVILPQLLDTNSKVEGSRDIESLAIHFQIFIIQISTTDYKKHYYNV